jgi:hypothetical protein
MCAHPGCIHRAEANLKFCRGHEGGFDVGDKGRTAREASPKVEPYTPEEYADALAERDEARAERDAYKAASLRNNTERLQIEAQLKQVTKELDEARSQCCMCGKKGLSIVEDDGPECELSDGRWVCSAECWERAAGFDPGELGDLRAQLAASEAGAAALREALTKARDTGTARGGEFNPMTHEWFAEINAALSSSAGTGWVRAEVVEQAREALEKALPFIKHGNCDCAECKKHSPGWEAEEKVLAALAALAPPKAK